MPKKILLVDDSNTALMMEKMILGGMGYELVVARDGEEGVRKALAERPDLILMDMVMPKLGGLEACKRLRAESATQSIPILMVTTRGEAASIVLGRESGCTDYITKPISNTELQAKVRVLLGEGA